MISIVICSIDSIQLDEFKVFVDGTIGIECEVVTIDNSNENLSISAAYNKGANLAKFDILAFVHEDVVFHTPSWGEILVQYFETLENPGVLGVAGSSYLPIVPSDWWLSDPTYLHANFLSNGKNGSVGEGGLKQWGEQVPQSVFALDGMFLAMKRSVWEEFRYDENLEGFHGYDTSICYRVSQRYKNYFVPGILIEHFSKGYPSPTWLINTVKAKESIAQSLDNLGGQHLDRKLEIKVYHLFLRQLSRFSDSWIFNVRYSFIYGWKLTQCFLSFRTIYLWLGFQCLYFTKLLKR